MNVWVTVIGASREIFGHVTFVLCSLCNLAGRYTDITAVNSLWLCFMWASWPQNALKPWKFEIVCLNYKQFSLSWSLSSHKAPLGGPQKDELILLTSMTWCILRANQSQYPAAHPCRKLTYSQKYVGFLCWMRQLRCCRADPWPGFCREVLWRSDKFSLSLSFRLFLHSCLDDIS